MQYIEICVSCLNYLVSFYHPSYLSVVVINVENESIIFRRYAVCRRYSAIYTKASEGNIDRLTFHGSWLQWGTRVYVIEARVKCRVESLIVSSMGCYSIRPLRFKYHSQICRFATIIKNSQAKRNDTIWVGKTRLKYYNEYVSELYIWFICHWLRLRLRLRLRQVYSTKYIQVPYQVYMNFLEIQVIL